MKNSWKYAAELVADLKASAEKQNESKEPRKIKNEKYAKYAHNLAEPGSVGLFEFIPEDELSDFFDSPLEALAAADPLVDKVPVRVLAPVIYGLQEYFTASGELSLEDIFNGPATQRVGNYAARRAKAEMYSDFERYSWSLRKQAKMDGKPEPTKSEIAESFAYFRNIPIEADSFARSYRNNHKQTHWSEVEVDKAVLENKGD